MHLTPLLPSLSKIFMYLLEKKVSLFFLNMFEVTKFLNDILSNRPNVSGRSVADLRGKP